MTSIYDLLMDCLMRGRPVEWSRLCSWCSTPAELSVAVSKCAFYGIEIANRPSRNAQFVQKGGSN
jgi:hypothetical protein